MPSPMNDYMFDRYVKHARKFKPALMELPTERVLALVDENERMREGIREVVEGLDRADAYDTPLYERLTALLDDTRIPNRSTK